MDENDRLKSGKLGELDDDCDPVQPTQTRPRKGKRPEIILGSRVDLSAEEAVAALAELPDIFQRQQRLERVAGGHILPLTAPALTTHMSRAADYKVFQRKGKGGGAWVPAAPPISLAKSVNDAGFYPGVRELEGLTSTPILRPDGSIVATPGYDPVTKLFYAPKGPIPHLISRPTLHDARAAIAALLDVVDEVCFARDTDRAAWLSLVLTLAARNAIEGPTPLFVSIANQKRTGKTQLVQWAGLIALGEWAGTTPWPRERSGEELRKSVDAAILGGKPLVLFDNIHGAIAGGALEAAVTTTAYSPRILGSSELPTVAQRTVFAASAHGAQLGGDMADRTLPIRLFFKGPNPKNRAFRRPNLRAYIQSQQGQLYAAALTILSAYLQAGAPDQDLIVWGSREAWSALIRHALVWAGQPDPYDTRDGIEAIDQASEAHDRLVAFIVDVFPSRAWTAGELAGRLEGQGFSDLWGWGRQDAHDLAAELNVWDAKAGKVDRRRLGMELRSRLDRPALDGHRITFALDEHGKPLRHRTNVPIYTIIS